MDGIRRGCGALPRWGWIGAAAALAGVLHAPAGAQGPGWEPVESIGQPSRLRPYVTFGYGVDGEAAGGGAGVGGTVGVHRDLFIQHYGAPALTLEGYAGQRGRALDGGARVMLDGPALFVHGGVDWNARLRSADPILGLNFPVRRGGWPTRGGLLRIDWLPTRGNGIGVSATMPLGQPLAGRTRPRRTGAPLPEVQGPAAVPLAPPSPATTDALTALRESSRWLLSLHTFFAGIGDGSLDHARAVAQARTRLERFRRALDTRASLLPDRGTYAHEVDHYHRTLDRAFGLALGASEDRAAEDGRPFADAARQVALDEVVFPYNRTVGRFKEPDSLHGLTARARARYAAWLALEGPAAAAAHDDVLAVFGAWLRDLEDIHGQFGRISGDARTHWMPLALVLRPQEHVTQAQIDALVERGLGRGFTRGNATLYVNSNQFQDEVARSIQETERHHVLWVHDFAGRTSGGGADSTAFRHVQGYLRALARHVRAYDETGRIPAYVLLLDQHLYELRDSRVWLDLLERPLTHRVRLPRGHGEMAASVAALQDSLRAAVAGSRRLEAEADALGRRWIELTVKVHVNVTNPSDFSFRTRRVLSFPTGTDNLMRDHRKIALRDVSEADPMAGEMIVGGVGVGDMYGTPTWDDRILLVQGPAALEALEVVRQILERHGIRGEALPAPLRRAPAPPDLDARVAAAERAGASARVLQVHNRTGWGPKDATFVQMLLYDLVPPGTVLYVPDSLWTSFPWMSQLVSAALRGCRVYVVAPALANAPSDGFPQMSRSQELVARLVLVREQLGDLIATAGGELHVGLFTREASLDDVPGLLAEMEETYARTPDLQRLFPATDSARAWLDGGGWTGTAAGEESGGRPRIHRKTQLIVSGAVLEALAATPAARGLLPDAPDGPGERAGTVESGPLVAQTRMDPARAVLRIYDDVRSAVPEADPVLYFMTGSLNKDVRSMALDGEVLAVVAGPWALMAYTDFAVLSGGVTWVRDLDEVEALLPPYGRLRRWIGRWLDPLL